MLLRLGWEDFVDGDGVEARGAGVSRQSSLRPLGSHILQLEIWWYDEVPASRYPAIECCRSAAEKIMAEKPAPLLHSAECRMSSIHQSFILIISLSFWYTGGSSRSCEFRAVDVLKRRTTLTLRTVSKIVTDCHCFLYTYCSLIMR